MHAHMDFIGHVCRGDAGSGQRTEHDKAMWSAIINKFRAFQIGEVVITCPCTDEGEAYILLCIRRRLRKESMKGAEFDLDAVLGEVQTRIMHEASVEANDNGDGENGDVMGR